MPNMYEIILALISLLAAGIYGFAAFSAFSIRRRLSGVIYRGQASGIGLVTLLFGAFTISQTLDPDQVSQFSYLSYFLVFLATFYWIDSSIRVARFTDPLLRDTFHWSQLRIALWVYEIAAFLIVILGGGVIQSQKIQISQSIGILFGLLFVSLSLVTVFSAFVFFPLVAHRSKDKQLKLHLEWFAAYAMTYFALFVVGQFYFIAGAVGLAIAGYLLYRCARSLVPIYSFATEINPKSK